MAAGEEDARMSMHHAEVSPLMAELSAYIAGALLRPLPPSVVAKAKAHVLDTLAAIISGAALPAGEKAIKYVRTQGGVAEALVLTTDIMTSAANAAFANGVSAHADETDDSHKASRSHLGCSIVPAALAMAEKQAAGGEALLRAVVLGYDIGSRVLLALHPLKFHQAGHCTHAFAGVFGSAAAAGALAKLTPEELRWTLSYAAQQAAGITSWRRAVEHIEKAFVFAGMPARNGVSAANMVASGFTGVNDVFAGAQNFFLSFGVEPRSQELVDGLGQHFEILNTTIKKWSVGSPVQSVLDATQILMQEHSIVHATIAEIEVRMAPIEIDTVDNRAMPDISLQHLVAVLLIDGNLTFGSSHDVSRMHDPAVIALKKKITLTADPQVDRQRALVTIVTRDQRRFVHRATAVRGTPDNPMEEEEIAAKAMDLMSPDRGKAIARDLIDTIWHIEKIDDVRRLRPLLAAVAPQRSS
jgi:2-methylcitrate dehydratase PrpD